MTPLTNHDVEISIFHDYLEDQGIVVDRTPEEQDQWIYEYKNCSVGVGGIWGGIGGFFGGVGGGVVGVVRVGGGVGGIGEYGVGGGWWWW